MQYYHTGYYHLFNVHVINFNVLLMFICAQCSTVGYRFMPVLLCADRPAGVSVLILQPH